MAVAVRGGRLEIVQPSRACTSLLMVAFQSGRSGPAAGAGRRWGARLRRAATSRRGSARGRVSSRRVRPPPLFVEAAAIAGGSDIAGGSATPARVPRTVAVPVVVDAGCGVGVTSLRGVLEGDVLMWLPVIADGFDVADGCVARRARVSARSM